MNICKIDRIVVIFLIGDLTMYFKNLSIFLFSFFLISNSFAAKLEGYEIDEKETHEEYKIKLISGKKDDVRIYQANHSFELNHPIKIVLNSILNFEEKCNNEYKDQRKLTDKSKSCKFHNGNLIESKIIKDLKKYTPDPYESDRFLIARRIYNRENFSHMDLVKIYKKMNKEGQEVIEVKLDMVDDKVAKALTNPPVEKDSVFQRASSYFVLTQINKNKTKFEYTYTSETDHWLLNKSISVGKVFESMAKSIDLLFVSIKKNTDDLSTDKTKVVSKSNL